jgi:F1F0 ATPase subunit 2
MTEIMLACMALFAGILLGAVFFGGLWWTVSKGLSAKRPALWFIVSLALRTAVTLTGFYFVSGGDWKRLLACLFGFIIARFIVTRWTASPMRSGTGIKGARDAS